MSFFRSQSGSITSPVILPDLWWQSLEELPLRCFLKVWDTGNHQALIRSGSPSPQALSDAWDDIYTEFTEIIGDTSHTLRLANSKRVAVNKSKLLYLIEAFKYLHYVQDPEMVEMLKEDGVNIDMDNFAESLDAEMRNLHKIKTRIEMAEGEMQRNNNNDSSLLDLIGELEKFQGYHFDRDLTTAKELAYIYKRWQKTVK